MARILFADSWADLGGGQRLLIDLVRYLRSESHDCAIAFPRDGVVPELLRSEGASTFIYDLPAMSPGRKRLGEKTRFLLGARAAAASLTRIGRAFGADVLFCNGGRPVMATVLAARRLRIPVLCFIQLIYAGSERRLLEWCFRRSAVSAVTFCSDAAAASFASVGPKAITVSNWVSPAFLEIPQPERKRSDVVRVGVLGRISPTKGQRLFLEALLPLLSEDPRVRLAIGGAPDFEDPGEAEALRALGAQSRNADRVDFYGGVDALEFLDDLDILVVPSLWEEPFGLVAVEGMARALPVVATRSGALPEIVVDGTTGVVVERNAVELRAAVSRLVSDLDLRRSFGSAGREHVRRHFHPARQLPVVAELVERAVKPSPPAPAGLPTTRPL